MSYNSGVEELKKKKKKEKKRGNEKGERRKGRGGHSIKLYKIIKS